MPFSRLPAWGASAIKTVLTYIRNAAKPVFFDACYWTAFWFIQVLARGHTRTEQVLVSILVTAALAALADLAGSKRKYFYLAAGFVLWLGGAFDLVFLSATGIAANPFTLLTAANYAVGDGHEYTYISLPAATFVWLAILGLPFAFLAICWRNLDWPASRRREIVLAGVFLAAFPLDFAINAGHRIYHPANDGKRIVAFSYSATNRFQEMATLFAPLPFPFDYFPPAFGIGVVRRYFLLRSALDHLDVGAPPLVTRHQTERPFTLVVIVGESTGRRHMSLYGYCRDTTPPLRALAPELTVFQDAASEMPLTLFALTDALVLHDVETRKGVADTSVIQAFNVAGFSTYWLSNQFEYGIKIDPVTIIASGAEHRLWAYRWIHDAGADTTTKDAVLLPVLQQALRDPARDKAIFLHQLGAHVTYSDRYPAPFAKEGPSGMVPGRTPQQSKTINQYDTAVRYTDFFVSQVIGEVASAGGDAAVVYFSDHGEEVFEDIDWFGHRFPNATRAMVEIPLLVWLSPSLRADRPDLVAALGRARSQRVDTSNLSALLLDVADIDVAGLPAGRDPLSQKFSAPIRTVDGLNYDHDRTLGLTSVFPPQCPRAP